MRDHAPRLEVIRPAWRQIMVELPRRSGKRLREWLARDWAGERLLAGGALVMALAILLALTFHVNRPEPFVPYHDTLEYVRSADRILSGGWWVDPARLPGYPLLLAGIFLLAGKNNLAAADLAQHLLFVVAAVEVYILGYRVWRSARYATLIGVLFATNFYFLSYVKPILSDGLALVLTVSLALAVVACIQRPRVGAFWLVGGLLLALIMTRAEWYLLPAPLFAYLLFVAWRHGRLRLLAPHALLVALLLYGALGFYVRLNAAIYGVNGITEIEDLNLYGKVLQYQMQGEAPPQYATITRISNGYVQSKEYDPWFIYRHEPYLAADHFTKLGAYARAIIIRHPIQFLDYSARLLVRTLYEHWAFATLIPRAPGAGILFAAEQFSSLTYALFLLFPFCALGWWIALWRRWRVLDRWRIEVICALTLFACYDLALTTLGSYGEYPRLHLSFDPLMLVVVVGSLLLLARRPGRRSTAYGAVARQPTEALRHGKPGA